MSFKTKDEFWAACEANFENENYAGCLKIIKAEFEAHKDDEHDWFAENVTEFFHRRCLQNLFEWMLAVEEPAKVYSAEFLVTIAKAAYRDSDHGTLKTYSSRFLTAMQAVKKHFSPFSVLLYLKDFPFFDHLLECAILEFVEKSRGPQSDASAVKYMRWCLLMVIVTQDEARVTLTQRLALGVLVAEPIGLAVDLALGFAHVTDNEALKEQLLPLSRQVNADQSMAAAKLRVLEESTELQDGWKKLMEKVSPQPAAANPGPPQIPLADFSKLTIWNLIWASCAEGTLQDINENTPVDSFKLRNKVEDRVAATTPVQPEQAMPLAGPGAHHAQ